MVDDNPTSSDSETRDRNSLRSTRGDRVFLHVIAWIIPLALLTFVVPMYDPIFRKLDEGGQLPQMTYWVWTLSRLNSACYYVPSVIAFPLIFAAAECVILLGRGARSRRLWAWVGLAASMGDAILASVIIVRALMLPVFRLGSSVAQAGMW